MQQYEKAIPYFDKAIEFDAKDPNFYFQKGNHLIYINQKAIEIDPYNSRYQLKGQCLFQLQEYEQALMCFEKASLIDPKVDSYQFNKGKCLAALKKFEATINCYDKAIEIDPNNSQYYNEKGNYKIH